ncbi:PAB-dependent poly(A)-specific ribonuclease subunit PAN3 [Tothia fuscella]|uniref:PAN2-PAN3 deadenylation complex subunit PAN3 n=1 Tax=Tothia fuscella TaxID=1048955 RepID=A0A9P4NY81_9PEZI|nr:PAB-dependent poly(A)-specific ribonuclease subunit PAN3 [Tothia fuscella]
MATSSLGSSPGDARREAVSPRPKGRENARNTLCRNIGIYGHCRFQDDTCLYYHPPDQLKSGKPNSGQPYTNSARLNVDSPSFKPLQPTSNGLSAARSTISPKSANAAPFTPKTNPATLQPPSSTFSAPAQQSWQPHYQDFVPGGYETGQGMSHTDQHNATNMINTYDAFALGSNMGISNPQAQPTINPYAQDQTALANAYYQTAHTFAQPAQYHNYAPLGPHRDNLLQYQRTAHDLFIPDKLREDLQKKAEASWQTLPNSTLPATVDHYHSLVPLDTTNIRSTTIFGYVTWTYKAMSSKDAKWYTLRRLEGYKLTNEKAIQSHRPWKRIDNGNIVTVHEAFTTRDFGDSSLIVVTGYHPNSKTMSETYITTSTTQRFPGRQAALQPIPEPVLWSYIVQFACALKTIHMHGLAVRALYPSKVLITSKNRIRINGHAILDIVKYDAAVPLEDQQQEDLIQFGYLILSITSNTQLPSNSPASIQKAFDHISRVYAPKVKDVVDWLLNPQLTDGAGTSSGKSIDGLLGYISAEMANTLDSQLHASDILTSTLMGELENGRLVRLMAKLGLINERPEYEHNNRWSETGERYQLGLFRDYVFHAVDEQGKPVTDLGHIVTCLNKLDAGSAETVQLVSRDEQNVFVVSYKDLKKGIEASFNELSRGRGR